MVCKCYSNVLEMNKIYRSSRERYESIIKNDGPYWARSVAEDTLLEVDRYISTREIDPCGCTHDRCLDQIVDMIISYKAHLSREENEFARRSITDSAYVLLGMALNGKDISNMPVAKEKPNIVR